MAVKTSAGQKVHHKIIVIMTLLDCSTNIMIQYMRGYKGPLCTYFKNAYLHTEQNEMWVGGVKQTAELFVFCLLIGSHC